MTRSDFEAQFVELRPSLLSYLYRLTADRSSAQDLAQDTFLRALNALSGFRETARLKTWVFGIATNLARDNHRVRKRFADTAQDDCKRESMARPELGNRIYATMQAHPDRRFEVREHLGYCFMCMAKTLKLDEQIAVILADMYLFKRKEIAGMLNTTEGVVKHWLFNGRRHLQTKFEQRCALVNKQGACYQCAELADHLNRPPDAQRQVAELNFPPDAAPAHLLKLRAHLVQRLDPAEPFGAPVQQTITEILNTVLEETEAV